MTYYDQTKVGARMDDSEEDGLNEVSLLSLDNAI